MARIPKITIITPSYNQGQYIEQTILSVVNQQYPNLEYIIIDGGSTDNSMDIIKSYESNITYWISEKDKGQSDAINKGMAKATGEIVNWLNSDDYYMPGALHHIAQQFSDPGISCYCGRSRVFSETFEKFSTGTDVYPGNLAKTIGWARIDQPETFFRKSVWDTIGALNESFHYIMDKEWWVRYLFHYGLNGILKDNQVIVNFRIHENSKTGSQLPKFNQEILELYHSISKMQSLRNLFFEELGIATKELFGYNGVDKKLSVASVNYYLLLCALEAYAQNDYLRAHKAAEYINLHELEQTDIRRLEKILLRMKIIPVQLKKWYYYFKHNPS